MLEKDIQKQCIDYLELKGCVVVKINNVGIKKPDGSYIPPRQKGISDLICCTKSGNFLAVEVKCGKNKLTLPQTTFLHQINRTGAYGLVVWSLDELIKDCEENNILV